jgi:oxygen-dependent protoporphyrinogen oxidase
MTDVVVIGAGLAGLTAAYRLQTMNVDVQLVERASVVGGHLQTVVREGWRYEWGPNSFLGSARALFSLADELDLTPVKARAAASKRYLFLDGKLQALPSSPLQAITTGVLPLSAKLRALAEPLTGAVPGEEESVRDFFEQHLGREITERFVDAFVSGIYAGDIGETSMAAAFPRLFALVKQHKSLFRAAFAGRSGNTPQRGTFSFPGGLGDLPKAIAARLGDRVHLGADVGLARDANGWRVGDLRARAVVLATPAYASAELLETAAPALANELRGISYNPMAGVHLLLPKAALKRTLDGFGFLIPRREGVRLLGCIWSSALFDVCNSEQVALTCFIGGAHDREAVTLTEAQLVSEVRRDLERTLGVTAAPLDQAVIRIQRAIPAYGLQHLSRRARINALEAEQRGLTLAGNYLEGVSMNDTIMHAEKAARSALTSLAEERRAA